MSKLLVATAKKENVVQEEYTTTREISRRCVRNFDECSPENDGLQNENTISNQTNYQIINDEEKPSTNVVERTWAV